MASPDFACFSSSLIGLPISHIWRGYGSAIFLEFGKLHPRIRRNGSQGNPRGEWTLMIEWSWRIEGKRRVWCGSWSEEERWPGIFSKLEHAAVASVSLFGRLPEICLSLSNGLHVLSMMTAEGDPAWELTNHGVGDSTSMAGSAPGANKRIRDELPTIHPQPSKWEHWRPFLRGRARRQNDPVKGRSEHSCGAPH